MSGPKPIGNAARYVILAILSVVTVAPLIIVLLTAFQPPGAAVSGVALPTSLSLGTFSSAWEEGEFAGAFLTSGVIALLVVLLVTLGSIAAGYAFGTMKFPGHRALFYLFLAGIVVPYVALVVPIYLQFQTTGLLDTYWGLILAETGMYMSFGIFWMHAFFSSVPRALIESARIDGASSLRVLVQILLPVSRPAVATLMMLTFLSSWNEYLVPLILNGDGHIKTVSLGLASFQGQHLTDIPSLSAASIIVALPAVGIYLLTQRSFFRGLLAGAVK